MLRKLPCYLFLCFAICSLPTVWAKEIIGIEGTCTQLNTVLSKARNHAPADLRIADSITFLAYRAAANGQASIYNLALLSSGYEIPLLPKEAANPETDFFKKVITSCEHDASQAEYPQVVTQTIINVLKDLYQDEPQMRLDFKALLQQTPEPFPADYMIGLGKSLCTTVTTDLKNNPAKNSTYSAWLSGYLTPYMITQQLEPKRSLALVGEVFQQTVQRCAENPQKRFAEEALKTFSLTAPLR